MTSAKFSSALALALLFASCASPMTAEAGSHGELSPAVGHESKSGGKPEDVEGLALEVEKKERELHLAELELELTKDKTRSSSTSDQAALAAASFQTESARQALKHYIEVEAPRKLTQERLSLDGTQSRLDEQLQEQEQMEADYAPHLDVEDDHLKRTGEIVLARGLKRIGFARRRLALAEQALESLKVYEIPRKTAELEQALKEKEEAQARAEGKLERGKLEGVISMTKVRNKLDLLSYELSKARGKLAKVRAAAAEEQ